MNKREDGCAVCGTTQATSLLTSITSVQAGGAEHCCSSRMQEMPQTRFQLRPRVPRSFRRGEGFSCRAWLRALALVGLCWHIQAASTISRRAGRNVQPDSPLPEPSSPRRVALCFYGVTRSLRFTLPSIKSRLIDVMRGGGLEVDVFVHTYDMLKYVNPRDGKGTFEYHPFREDFKALNATRSLVTNQDDLDYAWPDPVSLSYYDWGYPRTSMAGRVQNVFRAYWSMSLAWGLMAQHGLENGFEYDAVVVARPDVWYHTDIDLPRREFPLPERVAFLPTFGSNSKGVNDKFAYGSLTAMRVVMHRMATFLDPDAFSYKKSVHSEWVLYHHLQVNDISTHPVRFPLARVRLTGAIAEYDYRHVKEACESGGDPMSCEIIRLGFKLPAPTGSLPSMTTVT